jgi:hypothetical protein
MLHKNGILPPETNSKTVKDNFKSHCTTFWKLARFNPCF